MGRIRILVLDSCESSREFVGQQLQVLGYEVVAVRTDQEALARLSSDHRIHGAIIELAVPMPGGVTLLQQLRLRRPVIPVITMGPVYQIAQLRQSMDCGADEYLVMPFDSELLREKCRRVFLVARGSA